MITRCEFHYAVSPQQLFWRGFFTLACRCSLSCFPYLHCANYILSREEMAALTLSSSRRWIGAAGVLFYSSGHFGVAG